MKGLDKYLNESVFDTDTDFDVVRARLDGGVIDPDIAKDLFGQDSDELVIPEGVVGVGYQAFRDWRNLRRVVLPSTLEAIDHSAFLGCDNLEEVVFAKNSRKLKTISSAFNGCLKLERLDMSHTQIDNVPGYFVAGAVGLKEVILPDTCTLIDKNAFVGCSKLGVVQAPGVIKVGTEAFARCRMLKTLELAPGVVLDAKVFDGCRRLVKLVNPIGGAVNRSFQGSNLQEIEWDGSGTITTASIQSSNILKIIITTPENKLRAKTKKDIANLIDKDDADVIYKSK